MLLLGTLQYGLTPLPFFLISPEQLLIGTRSDWFASILHRDSTFCEHCVSCVDLFFSLNATSRSVVVVNQTAMVTAVLFPFPFFFFPRLNSINNSLEGYSFSCSMKRSERKRGGSEFEFWTLFGSAAAAESQWATHGSSSFRASPCTNLGAAPALPSAQWLPPAQSLCRPIESRVSECVCLLNRC